MDRDTVIQFTKGLMDRLREFSGVMNDDKYLEWVDRSGNSEIETCFGFGVLIERHKYLHAKKDLFRVFFKEGNKLELIKIFDNEKKAKKFGKQLIVGVLKGDVNAGRN